MNIFSVRRDFASDHSSTSYEFLAIDTPLDIQARAVVSSLSRRANPTKRRVSFIYHADGYDIPGGWSPLMENYYDCMYSESYDWWLLALAFPLPPEQQEMIMQYDFRGVDDLGIDISLCDERVIVSIHCRLRPYILHDEYNGYGYEDEGEDDDAPKNDLFSMINDPILRLLAQIRKQLMQGDYRALYEVWKMYGFEEETEDDEQQWTHPPMPKEIDTGESIIAAFAEMLDTL